MMCGTASFDEEPPGVAFWRKKIVSVGARGWPFIVAVSGDELFGYSYATQSSRSNRMAAAAPQARTGAKRRSITN